MYRFVAIVGSNYDQSTNRLLLDYMAQHFAPVAQIDLLEIAELPVFSRDILSPLPESVQAFEDSLLAADGVIIATPEYDHAVPAVLMNALEWASVGRHALMAKPVMIVGAAYGTLGTSRAQAHLRQILNCPELSAYTMPSAHFLLSHSRQAFDENGQLQHPKVISRLEAVFQDFVQFVQLYDVVFKQSTPKESSPFSWEQQTENGGK